MSAKARIRNAMNKADGTGPRDFTLLITHGMAAIEDPGFFDPLVDLCYPGDTVLVMQVDQIDDDPRKMTVLAERPYRVLAVDLQTKTVSISPLADALYHTGDPVAGTDTSGYLDGEYRVQWNLGRKMHQVLQGDRVIFETEDKDEAHRVANGEQAIPAEAA